MRLEWAFRVSGYLTLATACLCLGSASMPFLPGIQYLIVPVLALLAIACCLEERFSLSARAANVLGIGITVGMGVWTGWSIVGRINDDGWDNVPMPASLLPYFGPFLVVLLLVKLVRPKQPTDYWVVQGIGLLLTALACALGSEPEFGLFLVAYLLCGLWHLSVFHERREFASLSSNVRHGNLISAAPENPTHSLFLSFVRATLWCLAALVVGLPIYLVLPRQGLRPWNPSFLIGGQNLAASRMAQTGFSNDIDLNRTGEVEVDDDVALVVAAEDAEGRPKLNLSESQRWRGAVLDYYSDGRWTGGLPRQRPLLPGFINNARRAPPPLVSLVFRPMTVATSESQLPDLGAQQFRLTFTSKASKAGGVFLADPVVCPEKDARRGNSYRFPVVSLRDELGMVPFFDEMHLTLQESQSAHRGEYRYRQVVCPPTARDLSFPVDEVAEASQALASPPPPESGITEWTTTLLNRLAAESAYGLTADDLRVAQDADNPQRPRAQEKIALALTNYFVQSGEFTYTLERPRDDPSIDPTFDFLENVKQGHCDRYAGALTLMLRSQGIRARIVKGFRGAESQGDGSYIIRQNFSHSWVEALVQRQGPDGASHWHWRTLDPTPSTSAPPPTPFSWSLWWRHNQRKGLATWLDFVANYEGEQQAAMMLDAWDSATNSEAAKKLSVMNAGSGWRIAAWLCLPLAAALGFFAIKRYRRRLPRRVANKPMVVPFYARMLEILARSAELRPSPGQTPREFGETARLRLAASDATTPLADLPVRLATLLYRVRFGFHPLSNEEEANVGKELDELAAAISL